MEYYCDGDLVSYIEKYGRLSLDESKKFVKKLAEALIELHSRNIVHRDLKPENIFISSKKNPVIGDFGLAEVITSGVSGM